MGIVLVFSLAISIGLFMILPYIASEALGKLIRNEYVILFMEGIIRIAIFLGYIVLISRMEDIKRVFMYHGAEHKTINCLEAGVPLTPENVDNFSRLHKRCGTSFIFIVMIISMVFFFFIRVDTIWLRIVLRLLFYHWWLAFPMNLSDLQEAVTIHLYRFSQTRTGTSETDNERTRSFYDRSCDRISGRRI